MKPLRFLLLSWLLYYAIATYLFFEVDVPAEAFSYVLAHFTIVALCNFLYIRKIILNNICIASSPVACLLFMTQLYITFNSFKYFVDTSLFYPMFELTTADQFVGFLLGESVVLVLIIFLDKSYYTTPGRFVEWSRANYKLIYFVSGLLLTSSVIIKIFLIRQGYGSTYSDSLFTKLDLRQRSDAILLNLNEVIDQFLLIFLFMGYFVLKGAKGSFNFIRKNSFLLAACLLFLYNLLLFKSRLLILFFIIVVMLLLQAFKPKKGMLSLSLLFIFLPCTIGALPMLNMLLGRDNLMSENMRILIQITSGRADLTDYAFAILKKSAFMGLNPSIAWQAFINAIPNVLFPGKDLFVVDAYSQGLEKIGWEAKTDSPLEIVDYQDSLFSAGAMSLGLIGFVTIPILYAAILSKSAWIVHKYIRKGFSAILIFPFTMIALKIEVEFSNIFINIRNAFQMMIVILLLSYLYLRFFGKRHYKAPLL